MITMKKLMLFAALLGFAVACGGGEKKEEPKNEQANTEVGAPEAPEAPETPGTPEQVTETKKPMEVGGVTELDKSKGLSVSQEIKTPVSAAVVEEETRGTLKDGQLTVQGVSEIDKTPNLQVGAELTTTPISVAK